MRTFRELFARIDASPKEKHILRTFNQSHRLDGKAKSVRELAESLGFSVRKVPMPAGMAGRLFQDGFSENGFEIQVNEKATRTTQRWAVLHEMGHYFMGHVRKDDLLAHDLFLDRAGTAFYADPKEETEANQFAAVLLFGDGSLEAARSLHGENVEALARVFGVSLQTAKIAMKQF